MKSLGAAYTMLSMEDERWINLIYLNLCFAADNFKQESERMIANNKAEVFAE